MIQEQDKLAVRNMEEHYNLEIQRILHQHK